MNRRFAANLVAYPFFNSLLGYNLSAPKGSGVDASRLSSC